jgi:hypothetical protein
MALNSKRSSPPQFKYKPYRSAVIPITGRYRPQPVPRPPAIVPSPKERALLELMRADRDYWEKVRIGNVEL